jgi:aldehyde dehydrogenase (NAD+)
MVQSDIQENLLRLRQFFSSGKTKELDYRIDALKKLKAEIMHRRDSIIDVLGVDLSKPPLEAYLSEIYFTIKEIDHTLKNLVKWVKPERVKGSFITFPSKSWITSEPYGVALIIGPWNYPFQLVISPLVSAIAAGNCAVVKPSELAPRTSSLIKEMIGSCFEEGFVKVVEGGPESAGELLSNRFDYIFYTGSTRVGKIVMEAASKNLTPVTLELGGKSPCVVDANINIERTAKKIVLGKFFNSGQTCVAPDHLFVNEDIVEKLTKEIISTIISFYGDNPSKSPDLAKIVTRKQFDRLKGMIAGDFISVGEHDPVTQKIAPTIIKNPSKDAKVMSEEIFGPILPIIKYSHIDEAIDRINRSPKPLALYIFSEDSSFQEKVINSTSSGGVCINDTILHITNLNLPFGGVGDSGIGSYHGRFGFETFSHKKSVMERKAWTDLFSQYPPYGDKIKRLIKFLK